MLFSRNKNEPIHSSRVPKEKRDACEKKIDKKFGYAKKQFYFTLVIINRLLHA